MSDFIGELELKDDEGNVLRVREYKSGVDFILTGETKDLGVICLSPESAQELSRWLSQDNEEDN